MLKLLLKHSGKILQLCSNFFLSYIVFLRKTRDKSWEKFPIVGEFAQKTPKNVSGKGYWRWSQRSTNGYRIHTLVKNMNVGLKLNGNAIFQAGLMWCFNKPTGLALTVLEPTRLSWAKKIQ